MERVWITFEGLKAATVNDPSALALPIAVGLIGALVLVYLLVKGSKKLWGKIAMAARAKLSKEVKRTFEDIVVCALSDATRPRIVKETSPTTGKVEDKVLPPKITIDEARIIYAKLGHLGFWGLHPRKFNKNKTGLELSELKEELRQRKADREASRNGNGASSKALMKLWDGLDAELN